MTETRRGLRLTSVATFAGKTTSVWIHAEPEPLRLHGGADVDLHGDEHVKSLMRMRAR